MKTLTLIIISTLLHFGLSDQNRPLTKEEIIGLPSIAADKLKIKKDTFSYFIVIDTNIIKYQLPKDFIKPKKWRQTYKNRPAWGYYGSGKADTLNLQKALAIIDREKDFGTVCTAKTWCLNNYSQAFPYLISRLSVKQKIGLTNSADMIIWERFGTEDLEFYGHGMTIAEDIFTISGRASMILNEITGENFAVIKPMTTKEQIDNYKSLWIEYIKKLKRTK